MSALGTTGLQIEIFSGAELTNDAIHSLRGIFGDHVEDSLSTHIN